MTTLRPLLLLLLLPLAGCRTPASDVKLSAGANPPATLNGPGAWSLHFSGGAGPAATKVAVAKVVDGRTAPLGAVGCDNWRADWTCEDDDVVVSFNHTTRKAALLVKASRRSAAFSCVLSGDPARAAWTAACTQSPVSTDVWSIVFNADAASGARAAVAKETAGRVTDMGTLTCENYRADWTCEDNNLVVSFNHTTRQAAVVIRASRRQVAFAGCRLSDDPARSTTWLASCLQGVEVAGK